ncbi:hypothetical protein [Streptomyces tailanensis]|uniref:hypothetical protein n=1 Tax=Streptomyces tailanensis TaxID=2569858 RepID=UPI00122DF081|nr:hypothetical protein [Streptomyces tailanensis]
MTRSERAGTRRVTASLRAGSPAGIVTEERPPKVSERSLPGSMAAPVVPWARRATRASPILSACRPNSFDRRMRGLSPAMLVRTI